MCFLCVSLEGGKAGGKAGGGENDEVLPHRMDIRVGKVVSVEKVGHEVWLLWKSWLELPLL